MITVSVKLFDCPSFTTSCTTYKPATVTWKEALAEEGFINNVPAPEGTDTKLQEKLSGCPSTSLDLLPSSITTAPIGTVWSAPASATGRELTVLMTTMSGELSSFPSLTTNWTP